MTVKCWLVELRYETEGGATKKRMMSRPMTYSRAVEVQTHWERRGAKARLVEIESITREQVARRALRRTP